MGISSVGQGMNASAVRHALVVALAFLALFYFLYGPPLTERFEQAAHRECNQMTGSTYRNYALEWKTAYYDGIERPHWVCYDLEEPGHRGTSLGWWVGI